LKQSSTILGSNYLSRSEVSSRQGFVLTSMSQTFKLASIMKSRPKTSKQFFLLKGLILL
jgi:hypothetical protein